MIHVETMPDQAGIAAALRRAFSAAPVHEEDADDMFEDLLRRLH